jgi:pyrroline-5-carboxylate reductase
VTASGGSAPGLGLVGCGNMGSALARGWGEPILCTDVLHARAQALAGELGGEAVESNEALGERATVVVLAHKPAQLGEVAAELGPALARRPGTAVVSLLARTSLDEVRIAYPGVAAFRVQPNLPVAVRRGVTVMAQPGENDDQALAGRVHDLFARVGAVVTVPDGLVDVAGGCCGVGPAYFSLVVEAQVDAAVRHGLTPADASVLIGETMGGTAELLRQDRWDTLGLRRRVTSPGGTTARGLAALERGGVRAAFAAAMDDVIRS